MRKKLLALLLSLGLMVFAVGCSAYPAYKNYYSNASDYHRIWKLEGFYRGPGEQSALFPQDLHELDITDYFCRYDQQLPLGEGVQLLLEVQYSDPIAFADEVNRIASITSNRSDAFSQNDYDAYALRICEELACEYAFADEDSQLICYIYLRNIPKKQIEIDHKLLPTGYSGYGELN